MRRGAILLGLVAASAGACNAPSTRAVPVVAEPAFAPGLASPSVEPSVPASASARHAEPASPEVPGSPPAPMTRVPCYHGPCEVDAIARCGNRPEIYVAAVEELAQCFAARVGVEREIIREAALQRAFVDGALLPGAGEPLVRSGILTPKQRGVLERAKQEVPRALAPQQPPYAGIASDRCWLIPPGKRDAPSSIASPLAQPTSSAGVELKCHTPGDCVGVCHRRFFAVYLGVGDTGLHVRRTAEESTDNGSCGCCG